LSPRARALCTFAVGLTLGVIVQLAIFIGEYWAVLICCVAACVWMQATLPSGGAARAHEADGGRGVRS
jgi:hypothetical protein